MRAASISSQHPPEGHAALSRWSHGACALQGQAAAAGRPCSHLHSRLTSQPVTTSGQNASDARRTCVSCGWPREQPDQGEVLCLWSRRGRKRKQSMQLMNADTKRLFRAESMLNNRGEELKMPCELLNSAVRFRDRCRVARVIADSQSTCRNQLSNQSLCPVLSMCSSSSAARQPAEAARRVAQAALCCSRLISCSARWQPI